MTTGSETHMASAASHSSVATSLSAAKVPNSVTVACFHVKQLKKVRNCLTLKMSETSVSIDQLIQCDVLKSTVT
jgi:hypothetical protein